MDRELTLNSVDVIRNIKEQIEAIDWGLLENLDPKNASEEDERRLESIVSLYKQLSMKVTDENELKDVKEKLKSFKIKSSFN